MRSFVQVADYSIQVVNSSLASVIPSESVAIHKNYAVLFRSQNIYILVHHLNSREEQGVTQTKENMPKTK